MLKKSTLKDIISERILDWIKVNHLVPGDRLLSEKNISKLFGINHLTVRSALFELEKNHIIERRPRSGTYIKKLPDRADYSHNNTEGNGLVTILMRPSGHFHADLLNCLCQKLQFQGYVPLLVPLPVRDAVSLSSNDDYGPALEHIRKTWDMGSNRLIVGSDIHLWLEPLFSQLELHYWQNTHWQQIVWVGEELPSPDICGDVVMIDYQSTYANVINYLKGLGHREIAFLTNWKNPDHPFPEYQNKYITCFKTVMLEAGLTNNPTIITQRELNEDDDRKIKELLLNKARPTAIFASSDFRLVSVCRIAMELGMKIPDDLALVGNFNTPWAVKYSLTSLSSEIDAISDEAMSLLNKSKRTPGDRRVIKVPARIITRESTEGRQQFQHGNVIEVFG